MDIVWASGMLERHTGKKCKKILQSTVFPASAESSERNAEYKHILLKRTEPPPEKERTSTRSSDNVSDVLVLDQISPLK